MIDKLKLVAVGNGMVGHKFIDKLTEQNTEGRYQIVTFCEEPRPAYDRVKLSSYFTGTTVDELTGQDNKPPMKTYLTSRLLKSAWLSSLE